MYAFQIHERAFALQSGLHFRCHSLVLEIANDDFKPTTLSDTSRIVELGPHWISHALAGGLTPDSEEVVPELYFSRFWRGVKDLLCHFRNHALRRDF